MLCLDLLGDWNVDDENRNSDREERPLYTFVLRVFMLQYRILNASSRLPHTTFHSILFWVYSAKDSIGADGRCATSLSWHAK